MGNGRILGDKIMYFCGVMQEGCMGVEMGIWDS
jgi:hypothetical protein